MDFRTDILPLKNELFRLALRITMNRAEAEDVVQETMIRVWQRRDRWDEIESVEAFCLTICRNLALDRAKRAANKTLSINADYAAEAVASENPERSVERQDRTDIVRRIIDSLPERQRTIIQLREIEGHSYKEIADILDLSEEQVKVTLFRARQAIKAKYAQIEDYKQA